MLERINPFFISTDHFGTFRHFPSGKRATGDLVGHIGLPLLATALAFATRMELTSGGVSLLVTSLSVFVGLLFNLLVLAVGLRIADPRSVIYAAARQLSREILINVEYAISVAFVAIVLLLPAAASVPVAILPPAVLDMGWRLTSAVCAGLLVSFVLTLLMILKRMHTVLIQHFNESNKPSA